MTTDAIICASTTIKFNKNSLEVAIQTRKKEAVTVWYYPLSSRPTISGVQTMQYVTFGIFGTYGDAEATVQDLELAGIEGEQVEVISDPDEDTRTANIPGEPVTKPHEAPHSRIARLLEAIGRREKPEVRDVPGEQPNYIGEQEFYANHIKQGGAVMIVRTPTEQVANRAASILHEHGARASGRKDGPVVRRID